MYSWWWVELSPETCRVKPLRRINAIVASCWIYYTILSSLLFFCPFSWLEPLSMQQWNKKKSSDARSSVGCGSIVHFWSDTLVSIWGYGQHTSTILLCQILKITNFAEPNRYWCHIQTHWCCVAAFAFPRYQNMVSCEDCILQPL